MQLIVHNKACASAPGHQPSSQAGLSMIELMVGLTIGLVLTLGLFTMLAGSSQAFKQQDDFARMQDSASAAFRYLGDSIRQAGFVGNTSDPSTIAFVAGSAVATTVDCGSGANPPSANWALTFTQPIVAFTGLTPLTVNAVFPCILAVNFNAGPPIANPNPILVVRGASGYRICNALVAAPGPPACTNPNALLTAQQNYTTTIYVQADPYKGIVFYGADYANLSASATARFYSNGNDLEMFEYRAHVYYVRPCSRPAGGATNCTGPADDNNHPIPTLVRQELNGSAMTEVPLVEGIDLVDYRFGVDNNGDGVPDVFKESPVAGDWPNVVAVKVSLLVRSSTLSTEYDDSPKQYDLDGDGVIDYKCTLLPAPACKYKRKVFSQVFQARNLAQRKGG